MHSALSTSLEEEPVAAHADSFAAYNGLHLGGRVRVLAFGRTYPGETLPNWSLAPLRDPGVPEEDSAAGRHLPDILQAIGSREILAPSPVDFNAHICARTDLNRVQYLRQGSSLWCILRHGVKADGMVLARGQLLAISIGGCPYILLRRKDAVGGAHAGRRSILNEARFGNPSALPRTYESVVEPLLRAIGATTSAACREVEAVILFPISAEKLEHPWDNDKEAVLNKRRSRYIESQWGSACLPGWDNPASYRRGRLDLGTLISLQLQAHGVCPENIAIVNPPEELYDTRTEPKGHRNLLLVQRVH